MKLLILDGNSLVNRAFYGINSLSNREGFPTNAIYGFLNIYLKLLAEERPDGVCVAFDTPAPTFRRQRYEGYKASRKGMPEELAMQMPYLKQVLDALGVARMELDGWEADDILGTAARVCSEKGVQCMLVTGDRDTLQLVDDHTAVRLVLNKGKDRTYDPVSFKEEYGFTPEKLTDLKALMGDSSDEIPGVSGIGEKTALDLVRRFGSIDEIYPADDLPGVRDRVKQLLRTGEEQCRLSKWLATIDRNAPLNFDPESGWSGRADSEKLRELLEKLELRSLISRLVPEDTARGETIDAPECVVLDKGGFLAFTEGRQGVYYDIFGGFLSAGASGVWAAVRLDEEGTAEAFFASGVAKTGHGIKDQLRRLGITEMRGIKMDTSLAAYVADPSRSSCSLENCASSELGIDISSGELPAERRAALRAQCVQMLEQKLVPAIEEAGMGDLLKNIEIPLIWVLSDMEQAGFLVDRPGLESFGDWLSAAVEAEQEAIYSLAGESFNINSTKVLGEILFDKLGLPAVKKTKSGYSTDIEVLEKLEGRHEIISHIIYFRKLTKLKGTYAQGLVKAIEPDGRIRTSFNMTATATGRLSSTDPNLQNIPVRGQLGSEVRKYFVAPEGWVLVDADYSQIELRILAHISGDENMISSFKNGEDIHTATAAQVFNVQPGQVTPQMRSRAKAVNFGIVYGISDYALSQDIGVSRKEAKMYMDSYFERFSGVRRYMDNIREKAAQLGYVSTLYGRRRYLPELKSSNRNIREFGQRVALNAPIQGTAADIIKLAMIAVHRTLLDGGFRARLILQVHDELIVEAPAEEAEAVKELLVRNMSTAAVLSVPLVADASVGSTWLEAKP